MEWVLVCGIASEPPVADISRSLKQLGIPYVLWHQRNIEGNHCHSVGCDPTGTISIDGRDYFLDSCVGIYTRMNDLDIIPEFRDLEESADLRRHCRLQQRNLLSWIEHTDARVLNRTRDMASNSSKPFQMLAISKAGFAVPPTLVSNCESVVLDFVEEFGRVVVKGISGARTVVTEFSTEHRAKLSKLASCPVQFQAFIPGIDVRVHVIGEEMFASEISSTSTDYRYSNETAMHAIELPSMIRRQCLELSRSLRLPLAGIDLRRTPDGQWFCFEANPSPVFSYYQAHTGQPISQAIARYLIGNSS